jgi:dTDP-4-dehydrorhamnose 3,5-epimerase
MIKGVIITPLDVISATGGNVLHAMKKCDPGYSDFGEAYFSEVDFQCVKAWKRHNEMTLNLVVPVGQIRFVLFDDRKGLPGQFQEIVISKDNYCRLTIPPKIWMGFEGMFEHGSMLLNIADLEHNPNEVDRKNISEIEFKWG